MNEKDILSKIEHIKESTTSYKEKEDQLHELERKNQNKLFIKTDLCPHCGSRPSSTKKEPRYTRREH